MGRGSQVAAGVARLAQHQFGPRAPGRAAQVLPHLGQQQVVVLEPDQLGAEVIEEG